MYKRLILLSCLVVMLHVSTGAWAATWTGLGGDRDWYNSANWEPNYPGPTDHVDINDCDAADGPIITTDVTCGEIYGPGYNDQNTCTHTMEVTGAILNIGGMWRFANDDDMTSVVYATDSMIIVNGDFRWGDSAGAVGIFNISGGSLSVALLKIGDLGGGEFNVSGGAEVTVGTEINIDNAAQSVEINLDGGTITAQTMNLRKAVVNLDAGTMSCGTFEIGSGVVDINEGMLVIDGDVQTQMQGYVNNDHITAYDNTVGSDVVIDYNSVDDKTIVTATTQYT